MKKTINKLAENQIRTQSREEHAYDLYNKIVSYMNGNETIYEDVIISLVGYSGLSLLREFNLIETCAMFNGRKLYAL